LGVDWWDGGWDEEMEGGNGCVGIFPFVDSPILRLFIRSHRQSLLDSNR
jgi:hypothetical protein